MAIVGHEPVMVQEVLYFLSPRDGELHVDGTFGAGGYSRAILAAADCRVIALDRDPDAVARGQSLMREFPGRFTVVRGNFSDIFKIILDTGASKVDGIVLDLGVSNMQLTNPARGFSFQHDGPLDMRMSLAGVTAENIINSQSESELADLIFEFGEERRSRAIAKAIVRARKEKPIKRTAELAEIVSRAVGRGGRIHPATRTFQALRIFVNHEIEELKAGLQQTAISLSTGGRLVVVSFHSLEDREVKTFFRSRSGRAVKPSRHQPRKPFQDTSQIFVQSTHNAVKPQVEEIAINPRARSARLRAATRADISDFR